MKKQIKSNDEPVSAINKAIDHFPDDSLLKPLLMSHRSEVMEMCVLEYTQEYADKVRKIEMDRLKKNVEDAKKKAAEDIKAAQAKAAEDIKAIQAEAAEDIKAAQAKAAEDIKAIQAEADEDIKAAQAKAAEAENRAAEAEKKFNTRKNTLIQSMREQGLSEEKIQLIIDSVLN